MSSSRVLLKLVNINRNGGRMNKLSKERWRQLKKTKKRNNKVSLRSMSIF